MYHNIAKIYCVYLSLSFVVVGLAACSHMNIGKKRIDFFSNCGDPEISADILYSVERINDFAISNNVVITSSDERKCGYLFVNDTNEFVEGALTDYDLLMKAKDFFEQKGE